MMFTKYLLVVDDDVDVHNTDITFVPRACGFLSLVAVMDWWSRYVLAWRLSHTMEAVFCVEAWAAALRAGRQPPLISNPDPGSQFTSPLLVEAVESAGGRSAWTVGVGGVGRYPARALRLRSKYSVTSESAEALDDLLKTIASRGARAVMTFPDHCCSNGRSGDSVRDIAAKHFRVRERQVESKFSTLGRTGENRDDEGSRAARQHASELMVVLEPK